MTNCLFRMQMGQTICGGFPSGPAQFGENFSPGASQSPRAHRSHLRLAGSPAGPGQFGSRLNAGALQGMELSPVSDNGDGQLSENVQNQHEAYATAFRAMTSR
jgi:hypothetical protein